ncbi:hypothetical protein ES707_04261 [subsurface metagenome]
MRHVIRHGDRELAGEGDAVAVLVGEGDDRAEIDIRNRTLDAVDGLSGAQVRILAIARHVDEFVEQAEFVRAGLGIQGQREYRIAVRVRLIAGDDHLVRVGSPGGLHVVQRLAVLAVAGRRLLREQSERRQLGHGVARESERAGLVRAHGNQRRKRTGDERRSGRVLGRRSVSIAVVWAGAVRPGGQDVVFVDLDGDGGAGQDRNVVLDLHPERVGVEDGIVAIGVRRDDIGREVELCDQRVFGVVSGLAVQRSMIDLVLQHERIGAIGPDGQREHFTVSGTVESGARNAVFDVAVQRGSV